MPILEKTRDLTLAVSASLAPTVPELISTIDSIYQPSEEFQPLGPKPFETIAFAFIDNLRLVKQLATLKDPDLSTVTRINEDSIAAGLSFGFSAKGGADYFLKLIGSTRASEILNKISTNADQNSPIFQTALQDLTTRMTEGHIYATQGVPLGDGKNAASAHAIWGHARNGGLQPLPDMHLTLSQDIGRMFSAIYIGDGEEGLTNMLNDEKDILLCAMGDILMMNIAKGEGGRLAKIWSESKPNGLGWLPPIRQALFNEAFAKKKL